MLFSNFTRQRLNCDEAVLESLLSVSSESSVHCADAAAS
jgi:hypothetical protein